jgi:hypothetical protein
MDSVESSNCDFATDWRHEYVALQAIKKVLDYDLTSLFLTNLETAPFGEPYMAYQCESEQKTIGLIFSIIQICVNVCVSISLFSSFHQIKVLSVY